MNRHKRYKPSQSLVIFSYILMVLPYIVSILGIFLLFKFPYLGKNINLIISAVILILSVIITICCLFGHRKRSRGLIVFSMIFSILVTSAVSYADYIFFRMHHELGKIASTEEYVFSYLYTLKDSSLTSVEELHNKKVGLQPVTSNTCYQTIISGLQELNINETSYTPSSYANFVTAAGALLNGEVDAIAVDEQGLSMIGEIYPEFSSSTKQIVSFKQEVDNSNTASSVDMSTEPFTVLINGVDTRSGDLTTGSNADVIMLAAFNPQTMKLSLTSIPRDTYIRVTCRGNMNDKITHSGSGGVNCTIDSLEQELGITINYYVKANFKAVVSLVDAIGGIDVNVPISFCEQSSEDIPDALCMEAGYQHLSGEDALALSRHRKTLINGDIGRGVNQQIVIEGIINKLASGQILTSLDSLLSVVGNNVQTNMKQKDMYNLFGILTNLGAESTFSSTSALSISSSTISGHDLYIYEDWAGQEIYYYQPYEDSLEAVSTEVRRVLGVEDYPLPSNDFSFNANNPFDPYNLDTDYGY